MNSSTLPPHPLDHTGVTKILLSPAASDALQAVGPHHLAIVTEANATAPPEARGRLVIHCLPLTAETADAAFRVASGRAIAKPIKLKKP